MSKNITNRKKNSIDYGWIIKIAILSFIISISFSFVSETAIPNVNIIIGIMIAVIFIFIGIIFDMIGVAVTASDEAEFHSMASQKVKGAKMAIKLKKNASKVSSFCNDVVGDICGIISGSTGAVVSIKIAQISNLNPLLITLVTMGIISMLTISGKALFKGYAIKKSNRIIFRFAKILNIFSKD